MQSKNGVPALVVSAVGLVFAVFAPLFMPVAPPAWISGLIGLLTGGVAVLMALRGAGANEEELLGLRTGAKAAQRGQAPSRPVSVSPAVADILDILEDIAGEIEQKGARVIELDQVSLKLQGEQARLQGEHARLQGEVELRQQRAMELEQSIARVQGEIEQRTTRIAELEQNLSKSQAEMGRTRADFERKQRELTEAERAVSAQLE
ncbi:MAG: hypothetical protein RL701_1328 [Pseudomonadota bacterium]